MRSPALARRAAPRKVPRREKRRTSGVTGSKVTPQQLLPAGRPSRGTSGRAAAGRARGRGPMSPGRLVRAQCRRDGLQKSSSRTSDALHRVRRDQGLGCPACSSRRGNRGRSGAREAEPVDVGRVAHSARPFAGLAIAYSHTLRVRGGACVLPGPGACRLRLCDPVAQVCRASCSPYTTGTAIAQLRVAAALYFWAIRGHLQRGVITPLQAHPRSAAAHASTGRPAVAEAPSRRAAAWGCYCLRRSLV